MTAQQRKKTNYARKRGRMLREQREINEGTRPKVAILRARRKSRMAALKARKSQRNANEPTTIHISVVDHRSRGRLGGKAAKIGRPYHPRKAASL